MKTLIRSLLVLAALSAPSLTFAQAAKPTDKFSWTQDDGVTANAAATYRYEVEIDSKPLADPLVGVVCTGAARPWTCTAPIPAVTPSSHTVRLRAVDQSLPDVINWLFSEWSDPYVFIMRATPAKPANVRVVPGAP